MNRTELPWLLPASLASLTLAALVASGCEQKPATPSGTTPATGAGAATDDHDHAAGEDHDHDHAAGEDHDHDHAAGEDHDHDHAHGPVTALGEQTAGGFTITASRAGEVKAGSEGTFDLSITGTAKIAAVRLWIGVESGDGSVKARAEAEGAGWHAHAEAPSPMPEGSKLWVEVEAESGERALASFDLKQ